MKTVLRSVFSAIGWFLTVILLFFVLSGAYQHFVKADHYTGFFGIGYAVVVSGSMKPMLNEGDFIVYQEQSADRYEVGDVIVYVRDPGTPEEKLISHRIVSIDGDIVTAKGDANDLSDEPFDKSRIVGRMAFYIPKVGKAVDFVKTPVGYACICGFIVLLIILNLIAIRREPKEERQQ